MGIQVIKIPKYMLDFDTLKWCNKVPVKHEETPNYKITTYPNYTMRITMDNRHFYLSMLEILELGAKSALLRAFYALDNNKYFYL